MATTRVFITVAEASADLHAANLIRALREVRPDVVVEGLGGRRMREAGAVVHHETVDRAAMGWRAAFRAAEVWRLLRWTERHYERDRPDLAVCCDSWSMNWHFAKLAKSRGIPVFYYIAPQTWASRERRVERLRRYVDHLGCIWPFEEPYFRSHGVTATYVGHPLFDELPADRTPKPLLAAGDGPVIGILAGSRRSIAQHNFPHQVAVARRIAAAVPGSRFLVPTTPATHDVVTRLARGTGNMAVGLNEFDAMVRRCDLCVAVSGTATLHAAAYGVPMVVVYRASRLAWHAVGRWLVRTRTFSMVNWLSGEPEHIVPEYIPWYGSEQEVAERAIDYLRDPVKRAVQREKILRVVRSLDRPGASRTAADLALGLVAGASAG